MKTILVVEDEPKIAALARDYLEHAGFAVAIATDGRAALDALARSKPDLVVLDLGLPGLDGLDVTREIRRASMLPIVMLTARDDELDKLLGLELGADDYLTKPFSPRELVARVHALLRRVERMPEQSSGRLVVGDLEVDPAGRRAWRAGTEATLTPTEFDLLHHLVAHPGVVYARERLLTEVWGYRDGAGARTVDSHVRGLRSKLGADIVRTVHGVGYSLGIEP